MTKRAERARLAHQTVEICLAGKYKLPGGTGVSLRDEVSAAVRGTKLYRPGELRHKDVVPFKRKITTTEVTNETTLSAARRLVGSGQYHHVAALNFASARNPGGAFFSGSSAQEESLAIASALYLCVQRQDEFYRANAKTSDGLYSDHLIFSPAVPVFRDDEGNLLAKPYALSFITAPAPNAGVAHAKHVSLEHLRDTFRRRVALVLNAALTHHVDALVLGAWGCGVFKNDPRQVAELFAEHLKPGKPFAWAFEALTFAVLDHSTNRSTIAPFERQFK